jgi:hypothetical protein
VVDEGVDGVGSVHNLLFSIARITRKKDP